MYEKLEDLMYESKFSIYYSIVFSNKFSFIRTKIK